MGKKNRVSSDAHPVLMLFCFAVLLLLCWSCGSLCSWSLSCWSSVLLLASTKTRKVVRIGSWSLIVLHY